MNPPARANAALLAALAGSLAGCRSLEASAWNLRQLHEDDGSPRPVAAIMSPAEYELRQVFAGLASLGSSASFDPGSKPAGRVSAPRRRAYEELLELESFDSGDFGAWTVQAEIASWLAARSEQPAERAVAVRLCGRVAERLGDVLPSRTRADGEAPAPSADPDDLPERLAEVLDGLRAAARAGDADRVRELLAPYAPDALSLDAARRLLRMTALVAGDAAGQVRTALAEAAAGHARRVLALALEGALGDPSEVVAATAAGQVARLEPRRAFALANAASEAGAFGAVESVVREVTRAGLPVEQAGGPALDAWLELLLLHARVDVGALPGACFRALERLAPEGPRTLRVEEWEAWYEATRPGRVGSPAAERAGADARAEDAP